MHSEPASFSAAPPDNARHRPPAGIVEYVRLTRPKQWIKNLFVLAPLVFAKELFHPEALIVSLRAFLGFCFAASAVYIVNDFTDVEADRAHPEKKNRPLAARTVSGRGAVILIVVLLMLTALTVFSLRPLYILILAAYVLMNLAYSFRLKEVVLLDVFIIASGFMLRVLGGAAAIDVRVSSWIVLCTMFLSLFFGFAKRRSELVSAQDAGLAPDRKVLLLYRVQFIDQMLTIAAAGAIIAYALYTVAPRTVEMFHTENMIYTTIFVLFGIFRYLYLVQTTKVTENPTNAVTSDAAILVVLLLWVVTCVFLIYVAHPAPIVVPPPGA